MNMPRLFPKLGKSVKLKRVRNYVLVHGLHPSQCERVHPSHAVALSLCTGEYSLSEISYLFSQAFDIPDETAAQTVLAVTSRFPFALEFLSEADPQATARYDPVTFLFPGDSRPLGLSGIEPYPVPAGISLNLTFSCNFRCNYCYQAIATGAPQLLDPAKCLLLAEEASQWGVAYFGLTGGEPTLFPNWLELLEVAIAGGMTPVLTSNGAIIGCDPFVARRLRQIGLECITISLDASYEELHHQITGTKSTFRKVVSAIEYLVHEGIRVSVKCVLTPANLHDISSLIDFGANLGVAEIGISYKEGGAAGSLANTTPAVTARELERTRSLVRIKAGFLQGRCVIHPPNPPACAWDGGSMPCGGLYMGMSIFPSGDVSICDKLWNVPAFVYGNVFKQSLKEIWNGEALASIRRRAIDPSEIDPVCSACSKLLECRTGCFVDSFNSAGAYFAKHPDCHGPFSGCGGNDRYQTHAQQEEQTCNYTRGSR
jgi:radical SAM protein with 4Fe4S-binding SPASM domain